MPEHPYRFAFTVDDLPETSFLVHSFSGNEGLSQLYHFDILLVASDNTIPYDKVLQKPCRLSLAGRTHALAANGIVASLKFKQFESGRVLYEALLVPQFFNLTLRQYSQIFLEQSFPEILKAVLEQNNITNYTLKLTESYPKLEYACQFNESHYAFLARWMEHYGIYYYFQQGDAGETIIFTDASIAHTAFAGSKLLYHPISGLDEGEREMLVTNFIAEYTSVPEAVLLKDYSYQFPDVEMQGRAPVAPSGVGLHYSYGDNFKSPNEAEPIARIRAQEFQCRQLQMHGESLCPGMAAGYAFSLQGHFCQELNGSYLLTSIHHTARNRTALTTPAENQREEQDKAPVYSNTFTSIPLQQQFRPVRTTKKPRFYGLLSATIDAESSGKYAELDAHGRYKVVLPFDLSGRSGGKASSWIRLAEPYAGGNYGMHFPLHKGTEVLLSFVEGDVDRPLITGAVHNFEKPNHVATANQSVNAIVTAGGHQFAIGDTAGNGYMHMQVSSKKAGMAVLETGSGGNGSNGGNGDGNGGDGGDGGEGDSDDKGKFLTYSNEYYKGTFGQSTELTLGSSTEVTVGLKNELFGGGKGDISGGLSWGATFGTVLEYFKGDKVGSGDHEFLCAQELHQLAGSGVSILAGPPEVYDQMIKKMNTAFKLVVGASLAAAATTVGALAIQFHGKEVPKDGYKSASSIIGDVASGGDIVFDAAMMGCVHTYLKAIKGVMKASLVASAIEVTKNEGIELVTNTDIAPHAEIVMKNGSALDPLQKASITISGGSSIVLDGGGGDLNSIKMKLGSVASHPTLTMSTVELKMQTGIDPASLSIADGNITLKAKGESLSSSMDLNSFGTATLTGGTSKITLKNASCSIKSAEVKTTATGDTKITTATFTMSATGAATINGEVIKVG